MTVQGNRFQRWLQKIYQTRDQEISCSECLDLASHIVDMEVSGEDIRGKIPQFQQHIDQCAACRQEYETLRELRLLENEGELPSLDDLQNLIP
jgi:hypothetical protein